jgi:hypothetical protein
MVLTLACRFVQSVSNSSKDRMHTKDELTAKKSSNFITVTAGKEKNGKCDSLSIRSGLNVILRAIFRERDATAHPT